MADLETLTRERVKAVIEAEFAAEQFTVADDKLPRAAGKDGAPALACYPDDTTEEARNVTVAVCRVILQLYLAFEPEPDEHIVRDPGEIEAYAGRIRRAFKTQSQGSGSELWGLRVTRISYPDDPTGNRTRLEAEIRAMGPNDAGLPIGA